MRRAAADDDTDARSEEELAQAVRGQDTEAFGVLYARHYRAAYGFALLMAGGRDAADDLVAEAFLKVLRRVRAGGGPTQAFRSYLITTIRTTYYTELRQRRWIDPHVDPDVLSIPADTGGDPVLAAWDSAAVRAAVRTLPPRWQQVIWLLEAQRWSRVRSAR